jgi:hypothetical protein
MGTEAEDDDAVVFPRIHAHGECDGVEVVQPKVRQWHSRSLCGIQSKASRFSMGVTVFLDHDHAD